MPSSATRRSAKPCAAIRCCMPSARPRMSHRCRMPGTKRSCVLAPAPAVARAIAAAGRPLPGRRLRALCRASPAAPRPGSAGPSGFGLEILRHRLDFAPDTQEILPEDLPDLRFAVAALEQPADEVRVRRHVFQSGRQAVAHAVEVRSDADVIDADELDD